MYMLLHALYMSFIHVKVQHEYNTYIQKDILRKSVYDK